MSDSTSPVESTDPTVDTTIADTLTLAMLPGIGPRTLAGLLERFGDARSVLSASRVDLATVHGVGPKLIQAIQTALHQVDVESIVNWCQRNGADIVIRGSRLYPRWLLDLPDAPALLFARGRVEQADEIAVAIVGTRHATPYGLRQAERFGYALAKAGVTVVSGLARGIDAAAHEGALAGGGRTIAVLGGGLGHLYPSEHEGLASAVAADGAVISEYAPDARPRGGMFPQRNRLIAGLSLATLVVEAPDRSGALITARLATEQNRDVMAIPGPITSRASRGCNQLIRDGAKLVQTVDDILEELGPLRQPVEHPDGRELRSVSELTLNDIETRVLDQIGTESTLVDKVIRESGLPAHRVIAVISVLEVRRLVRRLSGQYVVRN